MDLHILLGEIMLGLILFRLIWGVFGSSTARFAGFVQRARAAISLSARPRRRGFGHNPLGGLSVLAMLLLLAVQVGLGLFATDEDGLDPAPLSHFSQLRYGADPRRSPRDRSSTSCSA